MKKMLENEPDMDKIQNIDIFRKSQCLPIDDDSYSFKGNCCYISEKFIHVSVSDLR